MLELYPLIFQPIFKERVWGGRRIQELYEKQLPPGVPIGESWEIVDRPGDESIVENGKFKGKTLRWLMENHASELLGTTRDYNGRFPIIIKILDAQDVLSLQVHPPADIAKELGGEPKTEMWYVTYAPQGSTIYSGLRHGVSKEEFIKKIDEGTLEECMQKFNVKEGDAFFIPSGRIHGLGKGPVIFEIQQNSDTTYRVYDWNRIGLDGKPRPLHIKEALKSINFSDYDGGLIKSRYSQNKTIKVRYLVEDKLFRVNACKVKRGVSFKLSSDGVQIIGIINGVTVISADECNLELRPGSFCMIPASSKQVSIYAIKQVEFLHIEAF
ncbi:MAG: class I mannose-6-phosphate isomerase [Verrucomicrobiae bacterium]|nr:class I mannose-6-phosphate isomerase [Verrucomicrobiae bacterium]